MVYKCKVCGQEEKTKKTMTQHIKEKHMNKVSESEKHSKWYYIIGGIFGGIATGFILIRILIYFFITWLFGGYIPSYGALDTALFLISAIYSIIFVKILSYSRDKQSEGLKWFGNKEINQYANKYKTRCNATKNSTDNIIPFRMLFWLTNFIHVLFFYVLSHSLFCFFFLTTHFTLVYHTPTHYFC